MNVQQVSPELNVQPRRGNQQIPSLTHYRPAMPFGNRKKNILEDLLSSVLSQFKKYHPSGNLKFKNLGIFQSLILRN